MVNSIIGKTYKAYDNSYILNLSTNRSTNQSSLPLFAPCGANGFTGIETIIVSDPYFQEIIHETGTEMISKTELFINVKHPTTGHTYRLLYSRSGVIDIPENPENPNTNLVI